MKPVVDRLTTDYAGKVDIVKMPLDKGDVGAERLASTFGVEYVPTFVFVDSKGVRRDLVVGETGEDGLRAKLDALR
jgi:thioredoxin-like negative regulator of GroEL